ncbi:unnamed protein product [Victoria cruziana]
MGLKRSSFPLLAFVLLVLPQVLARELVANAGRKDFYVNDADPPNGYGVLPPPTYGCQVYCGMYCCSPPDKEHGEAGKKAVVSKADQFKGG